METLSYLVEYVPYTFIQRKCGDAFCNKPEGHRIGNPGSRCDDSPFPYPQWERERIGYKRVETAL